MMFDHTNDLGIAHGLAPRAATTDNTPHVSTILDMQGKYAANWITLIGANTDVNATFATLVEESNDSGMSGANAVADEDLILTEASAGFTFADDNEVRKIGYRGSKRYIRVTITPTGNDSGNVFLAGVWTFLSDLAPFAQPA